MTCIKPHPLAHRALATLLFAALPAWAQTGPQPRLPTIDLTAGIHVMKVLRELGLAEDAPPVQYACELKFDGLALGLRYLDGVLVQAMHRGIVEALVGYPDVWRRYDLRFDRTNFAGNVLAAMALEGRRQAAKGGRPYARDEWLMPPFIVNAYYNPNANNTALPAGILQPPFFGKDRSIAANLGGIGMVVGHELTHGFDDQGAQYDADGNQRNWWQPDDLAQFQAKGACLAQQFSTFEARPGKPINGQLTLGENIADLGGIKHAFLAYRQLRAGADKTYVADGFTEDQQFFVAVGQAWCSHDRDAEALRRLTVDPHAPPMWRVNGALRNLPQFAEAFGCKAGAPMAPVARCTIW